MQINIKVKMNNVNQIIRAHGLDENGKVTAFLRDKVDTFCDPYVPRYEGRLSDDKTYPNNHSIKYIHKYAHYMYIGKKAVGKTKPMGVKRKISNIDLNYRGSPKRGKKWEKRMMLDRGKDVCNDLKKFIDGGNV